MVYFSLDAFEYTKSISNRSKFSVSSTDYAEAKEKFIAFYKTAYPDGRRAPITLFYMTCDENDNGIAVLRSWNYGGTDDLP